MIGWKQFLALFGAVALWLLPAVPASAAETGENHSLTVCFSMDSHKHAIRGAEFSVLQVAEMTEDGGGYVLSGRFEKFQAHFSERFSEEDADLPKEMLQSFKEEMTSGQDGGIKDGKNDTEVQRKVTDDEGRAVFENLGDGIYLIWESDAKDQAASYEIASPLLAGISSGEEDGADGSEVIVYPKTTILQKTEETPKTKETKAADGTNPKNDEKKSESSSDTGKAGIVRTSDDSGLEKAALLAFVFAAAGIYLMSGKNKKEG